jgi:hypothetical protein
MRQWTSRWVDPPDQNTFERSREPDPEDFAEHELLLFVAGKTEPCSNHLDIYYICIGSFAEVLLLEDTSRRRDGLFVNDETELGDTKVVGCSREVVAFTD